MTLAEELRGQHAQVVADSLSDAHDSWDEFQKTARRMAAQGMRSMSLYPADKTPRARAVAAAVAVRAEAEGFKVERGLTQAWGATVPLWKVSW